MKHKSNREAIDKIISDLNKMMAAPFAKEVENRAEERMRKKCLKQTVFHVKKAMGFTKEEKALIQRVCNLIKKNIREIEVG